MTDPAGGGAIGGRVWWGALLLVAAYTALALGVMARLDRTIDEVTYFNAARVMLDHGWSHGLSRLHGPIPFFFNQLLVGEVPPGGITAENDVAGLLFRSRLGLLPFGWLAATVVFVWARSLHGDRAGLFALGLFALQPLMVAYGALITVDMCALSLALAALFLVWLHLERPRWRTLLLAGVALGAACASKYLTLLIAPLVALCLAVGALSRGKSSRPARLLRAGIEVLTVAAVCIASLHAAYAFRGGWAGAEPELFESDWVRAWIRLPLLGTVLGALPGPFLQGVDYQLAVSREATEIYLNGRFAPGHGDYYLWILLCKTPEVVLLVGILALARWIRRWRSIAVSERRALAVLLPVAAVLFVYLSFFTSLQLGPRYLLLVYPIGFVLASPAVRRTPIVIGVLALVAAETARHYPNVLAYFNASSGGQARAYQRFRASACDWGQLRRDGRELLEATEPEPFEVLGENAGPRFGRVALYIGDLVRPDPEDPTRARHWLDPFEPVRHVGAAWWLFAVSPEAFARAAASGDERVRADHAVALLGAGSREDAAREIDALGDERAAPLRELLAVTRAFDAAPQDAALRTSAIRAWIRWGRLDLAEDLVRTSPTAGEPASRLLLADVLLRRERRQAAREVLDGMDPMPAAAELARASLYVRAGLLERAAAILEACLESPAEDVRRRAEEALAPVRGELERRRAFAALLGGE